MANKKIMALIGLLILASQGTDAFAQSSRDMIVEMELACYGDQKEKKGTIGWQDICYTWQDTSVAQNYSSRTQMINDSLDAFEGRPARTSQPEPQRKNLDYFKQLSEKPAVDEIQREKEVQGWLKEEYPYFYDEYKSKQDEIYYKNDLTDSGLYSWFKNIDYGMVIETDQKLQYYLENIFPLFQSEDYEHTVFSHDRLSAQPGDTPALSLGLGYRHYDKDLNLIMGGNGFWDYQTEHGHGRIGLGGELISSHGEARLNYYNGISDAKRVGEYFEKAVDGMDLEVGTQVPGAPIAKIFAGYQWYQMEHSEDLQGWTARLQLKPVKFFTVNAKAIDENEGERIYRLDGTVNFDFSSFALRDIKRDLKGGAPEAGQSDLRERLLDRVEREFNIRLEKWLAPVEEEPDQPEEEADFRLFLEIRFPGVQCGDCSDNNSNGVVDPDEGFELDLVVTNLSTDGTLTGISATEVTLSNNALFFDTNTSTHDLADAPPGVTVRTDILTDYDLTVDPSANAGDSTTVTIDVTINGNTQTYTFGPFVLGAVSNGQQFMPN